MSLVPFEVPDLVTVKLPPGKRQDGIRPPVTVPLEDLPSDVLDELLAEFVEAVQLKAKGKKVDG
jgi:hypothetical protein